MLLPEQRTKLDQTSDNLFYEMPRLVTHVDGTFIQRLTDLYKERLQPNSRIFDMMSSWISHLPSDIEFAWVEGHGMNAEELSKNSRLNHYFTQNLNENPHLPLENLAPSYFGKGQPPHYLRRCCVSPPSSGWVGVGPQRHEAPGKPELNNIVSNLTN
jgi:hypothetical protein